MLVFEVKDMTCGHCAATIGRALRAADASARFEFDVSARQVRIEPGEASGEELHAAIQEAGYTPALAEKAQAPQARSGGCCCAVKG